jgi:hypothetical protein
MYPCVQPCDTLHIETRPIENINIGDVTVFRRTGRLFGHRVFGKGVDEHGPYIVTRPDRSPQGNDGQIRERDILGVVSKIERKGKRVPTTPIPLRCQAKARVLIWECWNRHVKPGFIHVLRRVRLLKTCGVIASVCLRLLRPQFRYEVRTPLKPMQSHDLYRMFPPDKFDVSLPIHQGKPVLEWTLVLYLNQGQSPAAWATMIRTPEGCPSGKGWHVANVKTRLRYNAIGLNIKVLRKAWEILARNGMAIKPDA